MHVRMYIHVEKCGLRLLTAHKNILTLLCAAGAGTTVRMIFINAVSMLKQETHKIERHMPFLYYVM